MTTLYRPDLLYANGSFLSDAGLLVDDNGRVAAITAPDASADTVIPLAGKALLPGFVNTHSHSFQRLIRGKSESRVTSGKDFWSWRGTMYHAAAHLTPQQVYDVARMAFLEMALAGTTTVGEFHYVHTTPTGQPYDDPNILSKQVIAAAESIGIRIVLLRTAYLRAGYQLPPDPGQKRFYETSAAFLANIEALAKEIPANSPTVTVGVAPHSLRAVPLDALRAIAAWSRSQHLPLHMHMSEQVAENEACLREYGNTPVALLRDAGLLGPDWTAIHATHTTIDEIAMLATENATICACPTTERNLGDGIFAADRVMKIGVRVALGSDSQAQIDPLEDARELDYHLRLALQQRAILDQIPQGSEAQSLASRLFATATVNGARALAVPTGKLAPNSCADFFTIDRRDISIAGHSAENLLPLVVFGLNRTAIRDVAVNGNLIVRDGHHPHHEEIVTRYGEVHSSVWSTRSKAP
jgi:formimidoylglutamate deiminase